MGRGITRSADLDEGSRLLLARETLPADQFPAIRLATEQPAPLAVTFSGLLDWGEPYLKVGVMHYRSGLRLVWRSSTQETGSMVDQEVIGSQLKTDRFPFQSEGDITLAVRNANYTR